MLMAVRKFITRVMLTMGLLLVSMASPAVCQLNFNVSSSSNNEADAAFMAATNAWAAEFNDDITVNIDIRFANLGGLSLANTASANQANTFSEFTNAVNSDAFSGDDFTFTGALPVGSTFSVYINRTTEASGFDSETPYVDNDGGLNNSTVRMTTANAKALGLRDASDTLLDGTIVFNDSFSWDFDQSNGIDPNAVDFIGVAMHEIGHVLGFESGVDVLDINGDGFSSDDEFDFVSPIDFMRFSNDSETAGADIDFTADDRDKYASIDGGLTSFTGSGAEWSTGFEFGDGEQASHWKEQSGLGLMQPTTTTGTINSFTVHDLRAFDVIGYDRFTAVPEPSAMAILGVGILALAGRRRRSPTSP